MVFEKPIASRLRLANRGQLSKHEIEEDRERERETKGWWGVVEGSNSTKKKREKKEGEEGRSGREN